MSPIFTVIVIILAILAILDLIVGVSNDAINFLNSALGSKVAKKWVILTVASFGIMLGVITSNGMMEVARNGVFHPGMFTFSDIMILFVGIMLSDVILLHTFNSHCRHQPPFRWCSNFWVLRLRLPSTRFITTRHCRLPIWVSLSMQVRRWLSFRVFCRQLSLPLQSVRY